MTLRFADIRSQARELSGRLYRNFLVRAFFSTISVGFLSKVAILLTTLITVRALKPDEFGLYAGLAATAVLASTCWDLGVSAILTREVAYGGVRVREALLRCVVLRLQTLPVWIAVFAGGAWILARGGGVPTGAIVSFAGGSLLFGGSSLLYATLRGRLQFGLAESSVATGRFATVLLSLGGLPSIGIFHGLGFLAVAVLGGELVTFLTAAWLVINADPVILRHPSSESPPTELNAKERLTMREALPFAATSIMVMAVNRFDVVILAALSSREQLALYAPASRIQDALLMIPGTILGMGLPIFAREWKQPDRLAKVQATIRNLTLGGLLVTLPVTIVSLIMTPWLLAHVLGPGYLGATLATRILICGLPFGAILIPLVSALSGTGRALETTKVVGVVAIVAIGGHLSLDSWLGATGGAIATLLREPASIIAAVVLARRAGLFGDPKLERASATLSPIASVE